MTKKIDIHLPMEVDCVHHTDDPNEPVDFVSMDIKVSDPEVPSYYAKCPKCGREVIIAFDHF